MKDENCSGRHAIFSVGGCEREKKKRTIGQSLRITIGLRNRYVRRPLVELCVRQYKHAHTHIYQFWTYTHVYVYDNKIWSRKEILWACQFPSPSCRKRVFSLVQRTNTSEIEKLEVSKNFNFFWLFSADNTVNIATNLPDFAHDIIYDIARYVIVQVRAFCSAAHTRRRSGTRPFFKSNFIFARGTIYAFYTNRNGVIFLNTDRNHRVTTRGNFGSRVLEFRIQSYGPRGRFLNIAPSRVRENSSREI